MNEEKEFITHLIGLLDLLTNRKEDNGVLPPEISEEEQELEQTTIKLLNKLLQEQQ